MRLGFIEWPLKDLQENFASAMDSIAQYLPEGYKNILEMSVKTSLSPTLPIYFDKESFTASFKEAKTFKMEQQYQKKKQAKPETKKAESK